jgi:DNA-binding MarR family transcriptional regulator
VRPELPTLPTTLRDSPGFLLGKLAQRGSEVAESALASLDLKARHFGVLVTLEEHEPASQHLLSQVLQIDRTTMVAVIDHLERLTLVERGRQPGDRRTHQVRRTAAGRDATDQARTAMTRADAALVQRLSADELAQLLRLLHKLHAPEAESSNVSD